MRSVKLILLLIIFGGALIVAAVMPADTNGVPEGSGLGSWVMGLIGLALLVTGLVLLRKGYLAARRAQGNAPMTTAIKILLSVCGVLILAVIAYAVIDVRSRPQRPAPTVDAAGKTKADYVRQEQEEIRRRQGDAGPAPAPAPNVPAGGFK